MKSGFHVLVFLIALLLSPQLVREPYISKLPIVVVVALAAGLTLFTNARRTYAATQRSRDLGADQRQVYFNPNVHPVEKLMFMDQTTGCSTIVAGLGYLAMAVFLFVIWWVKGRPFSMS